MTKEKVEYSRSGPSGNIYHIIGKAQLALRKQHRILDYNEMWERVQKSHSYDEALAIIGEYVELAESP